MTKISEYSIEISTNENEMCVRYVAHPFIKIACVLYPLSLGLLYKGSFCGKNCEYFVYGGYVKVKFVECNSEFWAH